jgi:hypothetical protein
MTVPTFLSALPIKPEEAEKLRGLGVDSPEHLLALINAAPDAFVHFFGTEPTGRLEKALREIVPPDVSTDRASPPGVLGVPLDTPPKELAAKGLDLARRDALFNRLQRLKANRASPGEIEDAEQALDQFFAESH